MRNINNTDLKYLLFKNGLTEKDLARYFKKSYSTILNQLRYELPRSKKLQFKNAIKSIIKERRHNRNTTSNE